MHEPERLGPDAIPMRPPTADIGETSHSWGCVDRSSAKRWAPTKWFASGLHIDSVATELNASREQGGEYFDALRVPYCVKLRPPNPARTLPPRRSYRAFSPRCRRRDRARTRYRRWVRRGDTGARRAPPILFRSATIAPRSQIDALSGNGTTRNGTGIQRTKGLGLADLRRRGNWSERTPSSRAPSRDQDTSP